MKYTIEGLSQRVAVKLGLDSVDLILIRYIIDFYNSDKMKKIKHEDKDYVWIYYQNVINELPILKITDRQVIAERLGNLVKRNIMEFYIKRDKEGCFTFYRFIPEALTLLISDDTRKNEVDETKIDIMVKAFNEEREKERQIKKEKRKEKEGYGQNRIGEGYGQNTTPPGTVKTLDIDSSTKGINSSIKKEVNKAPENTGAKPFTNNHPVNLTKINKRILAITKTSFSAVEFFNCLPDETDEFCPTKTYERIQEFLYSLHECKIKSNYLFDDKWVERNHIDFKVLREKAVGTNGQSRLPYDDIQEMFEKSVKNYALMRKEGYWPADKEKLTLNFANFLYNFKQKTSWFLYCLFNEPREMQETCAEKVIESLSEDVKETIIDFGGGEVIGQDTWPKFSYYSKAKELYLWYAARVKKLCKYHTLRGMDGFRSYLGCFSDLIAMIYEFAQTWKGKWSVNNFGMNCKTWDLFLVWLEKEHGYVIDVGEKELNNAEERYDVQYPAKKRELVKN